MLRNIRMGLKKKGGGLNFWVLFQTLARKSGRTANFSGLQQSEATISPTGIRTSNRVTRIAIIHEMQRIVLCVLKYALCPELLSGPWIPQADLTSLITLVSGVVEYVLMSSAGDHIQKAAATGWGVFVCNIWLHISNRKSAPLSSSPQTWNTANTVASDQKCHLYLQSLLYSGPGTDLRILSVKLVRYIL